MTMTDIVHLLDSVAVLPGVGSVHIVNVVLHLIAVGIVLVAFFGKISLHTTGVPPLFYSCLLALPIANSLALLSKDAKKQDAVTAWLTYWVGFGLWTVVSSLLFNNIQEKKKKKEMAALEKEHVWVKLTSAVASGLLTEYILRITHVPLKQKTH